jgi:hypothetical protein
MLAPTKLRPSTCVAGRGGRGGRGAELEMVAGAELEMVAGRGAELEMDLALAAIKFSMPATRTQAARTAGISQPITR